MIIAVFRFLARINLASVVRGMASRVLNSMKKGDTVRCALTSSSAMSPAADIQNAAPDICLKTV